MRARRRDDKIESEGGGHTGRRKKYTDKAFERAVKGWFASISRTKQAQEPDGTAVLSDAGEPIFLTEYITPPGIAALCLALGIDRTTWHNYAAQDGKKETCEWARQKIEAYLEWELVTRRKGSLRGVTFSLEHNYGWRERLDVRHTGAVATAELKDAEEAIPMEQREELLRQIARHFCTESDSAQESK